MIPRGTPDIGWGDLAAGLLGCLWPAAGSQARARVEGRWALDATLACLSVRSGFDLVLQALALPQGSEVLVSAVTIPGMIEILRHHGLVAVPLDLDPRTLAPDPTAVASAVTPRTRAILVAHLFGSLMPLDAIAQIAHDHGLLLLEDCAQAYAASAYRRHPASDVSMWSFGPIKTATALGGALLCFKDRELLARARSIQARYPTQKRSTFARRVALFAALKLLAAPRLFGLFVALCRLRGIDYEALLVGATRGFGSSDLIGRIKYKPNAPLLRLLDRRIAQLSPAAIRQRIERAERICERLPPDRWPGSAAADHSHWVLPVASDDPEQLLTLLRANGFDATRRASTLITLPHAPQAAAMLERIVYLPTYPNMTAADEERLVRLIGGIGDRGLGIGD